LKEIKDLLGKLDKPAGQSSPKSDDGTHSIRIAAHSSQNNIWNDNTKVERLRHMMVIKGKDGVAVDKAYLEKTCLENGVAVVDSYKLKNTEDTRILLKSKKDAEALKSKLSNHEVDKVETRTPTINVVGLCREYDAGELTTMIKQQNMGIKELLESNVCDEDKKLDVVSIKAIRSNTAVFRATVRVSNVIRSVIAKQGDRLFIGAQPVCKVYDSYYVTRCYKCQQYGHNFKHCTNASACGQCAGNHETKECRSKNDRDMRCINCKNAHFHDVNHGVNYRGCPVLLDHQAKLRMSIPFHQQQH
jgi:hypothetical protein